MENIKVIPKEQLLHESFIRNEVLPEKQMRLKRSQSLRKALILGNTEHNKVKITFKSEDGTLKQVETTIWAVTQNFILLKGGLTIPIRSILDLEV